MGGDDVIFLPADEPGTAYLLRNGFGLIQGDYSAETRIFNFKVSGGKSYAGRASADGETFAWYDDAAAEAAFSQYDFRNKEFGEGRLVLDGYDGAAYTPAGGETIHGVYSSDGSGALRFSAPGKEFFFRLGEEDGTDVFYVRDKVFGTYYSADGNFLTVDGFGNVTDGSGTYEYTMETDDIITYTYFDKTWWDDVTVRCKLVTETGADSEIKTYIPDDGLGRTYEADGGKLVLDGFGGATYEPADGAAAEGSYTVVADSYDEDYNEIVYIIVEAGENYTFRLTYGSYPDGAGTFAAVGEELGEYETLLAAGDYGIARLFLDGCGNARILFSFVSPHDNGEYYDTAFYGTYRAENGAYRFTLTETNSKYEESVAEYKDQFSDFPFKVGELNGILYFSQFVESTAGSFSAREGTLVLDGFGSGSYTPANGDARACIYLTERTLVYLIDTESGETFYLRLDGENFRFVGKEAGTYYLYTAENGGTLGAETLFLDGEGNAVLTDKDNTGTGGKYTSADDGAYVFEAADKVFLFRPDLLRQPEGTYRVFTKELEAEKVYSSGHDGMLFVDKYGRATWIDGNSTDHSGLIAEKDGFLYLFTENNGEGKVWSFAVLGEDGTEFALIGDEYGVYSLLEKGILREKKLELDGHGGAKLYEGDNLLSEGTYEAAGNTGTQFIYTPSSEGESFRFLIGVVFTNDGTTEKIYVPYHGEWDFTAHTKAEAWESLVFDGYYTAYYTDERGFVRAYEYETLDETVIRLTDPGTGGYRYYRLNRAENTFSLIEDDYVLSDDGSVLLIYRGRETSIALPDSVIKLGEDAFYGTAVTDVDLNNVETVGGNAFESVATLTAVTAPKVKDIGTLAFFMNIKLKEIELPSIETVGEAAFRYCEELTAVTFGPGLRSVGQRAFLNLSAKNGTRFTVQGGVFAVSADDPATEDVNENSFEENALFEVGDLQTALAFYAADGWKSYAAQICLAEETPAAFYTVTMSDELVLDGRAKKNGEAIGVYTRTETDLTVYPCNGGDGLAGTFADGTLTFGGAAFLPEGTEVTFTEKETNAALVFRLGKGKIPATYNGESVTMTVGETITFEKDHYTFTVTLSGDKTFTTAKAFAPYTVTYKCGPNGTLELIFNDAEKKNVAAGTGSSIKIAGRSLRNNTMISFGTPEWKEENVYEITINGTATQNGTLSLPVVYRALITLDDTDNTFTYTSSIEYSEVPLGEETAKLVISYGEDLNVNGVSLAFGGTAAENLTYTAGTDNTNLTVNITVPDGDHAGNYTATVKLSVSTLTLTKDES